MKVEKSNKEIISLDIFDAVRLRPGMYIGNVSQITEKHPITENNKIILKDKTFSLGFNHLIVEILENAIDEAKRMKGKMKSIHVIVNMDTNEISIKDTGDGFYKADSNHAKTKKNVVRTAMENIHAGSNFSDTETNILGTFGVGAAVVNILSKKFMVTTVNSTSYVHYEWKDYKVIKEETRKKLDTDSLGTTVSFIPSDDVFHEFKWDIDMIRTYLSFKNYLASLDSKIKNLSINGKFILNGIENDLYIVKNFLPEQHIAIKSDIGTILLWQSYDDSTSVSFVNGSRCTGIHQKIVNDWINEYFGYNLAHHFYDTMISLDVPSKLMRFGDQNKSKYDVTKFEIEDLIEQGFKSKILRLLKGSDISKNIFESIEDRLQDESLKKIKKAQRTSKRKISEKYSPASKNKEFLYITEGISAAGAVKQARNSETDGVYALKGKIKNSRRLSDLADNKEILEIMSILGLDPQKETIPAYKNIVIATDSDEDGHHIASLIINFFYKWFPHIIREGRLLKLITPLIAADYKNNTKYFYTKEEFSKFSKNKKPSSVNYLKGLGSLSLDDWEWVMKNKTLFKFIEDKSAEKLLDIAFGDNAEKRKKWLSSKNF